MTTLYERWRQVAQEHRGEVALYDPANGNRCTFAQLASKAEKKSPERSVAFPQGQDFVLTLLRAWRSGQVACPLEPGQERPHFANLPANCTHLKITSATAGSARVVCFTGEQLAADADNIVQTMGLRPDWPNLGVISFAHSYGFSNLILPLLLHGIPLVVVESPLPEAVRRAAGNFDAVTLAAVPALWRAWHEASAIPHNVHLAISAGAPLSIELEGSVNAKQGLKLHNFYGSTECGGIAYDSTTTPRTEPAYVGTAMQNVRLSVARNGCLQVRSAAVGQTYWPKPAPALARGRFTSSDVAEIIDGSVYLRGRAGDQIHVAGRKVAPDSIERALQSHPAVRECLVFGAPSADKERTETIVACVASRSAVSGESLKHFLLDKIPAWQVPREWFFVKSLEPNGRGKISRVDWKKRYLKKHQRPSIR
ncbi:MAG TPA: fatty acid--CoA ligase family protein [Verrucomicrobiae bacterium]|nr:fatty acid--CoA ligase family protein [Verrucomicrobiae bacterium]